jgi:hypothetical protein
MPWLPTLLFLLLHLPACVIRAIRWESGQYLVCGPARVHGLVLTNFGQALGLAMFSIALAVQSFISTRLRANEVLVWMPLTIVLDVGAVSQMVVLIIEKYRDVEAGETRQKGLRVLWDALKEAIKKVKGAMTKNLLPGRGRWGAMTDFLLPLWRGRRDLEGTYNQWWQIHTLN